MAGKDTERERQRSRGSGRKSWQQQPWYGGRGFQSLAKVLNLVKSRGFTCVRPLVPSIQEGKIDPYAIKDSSSINGLQRTRTYH